MEAAIAYIRIHGVISQVIVVTGQMKTRLNALVTRAVILKGISVIGGSQNAVVSRHSGRLLCTWERCFTTFPLLGYTYRVRIALRKQYR